MQVYYYEPTPRAQPPPSLRLFIVSSVFVIYAAIVVHASGFFSRHENTWNDLSVTYVKDKYSCIRSMFTVHMICTWTTFLSGLFAIISRLFVHCFFTKDTMNTVHKIAGRTYIMGLLWTSATASLIRNEGLPFGTIISFAWVLGGVTFGWLSILLVNKDQSTANLKYLHGAFMFTSWFSIAGRVFNYATNKDFTCYTYPAYKPAHHKNLTGLLPDRDSYYDVYPWAHKEVWGWGLPLLYGPFLSFILLVLIWKYAKMYMYNA